MGAAATVRGAIARALALAGGDGAASLVQLGNLAIRHRVSIHAGNLCKREIKHLGAALALYK